MSEIRITHQQINQTLDNTVSRNILTDQFINNLRIGQNIGAQLIVIKNEFWLVIEGVKLAIPRDTVTNWNLHEGQVIKLKVKSLDNPVELQIVKAKTSKVDPATVSNLKNEQNANSKNIIADDKIVEKLPADSANNTNKDNDRLVREVRKFLNKGTDIKHSELSNPVQKTLKNVSTVVTTSNADSNVSDAIKSLIFASRHAITKEVQSLDKSTITTSENKSLKPEQVVVKPKQTAVKPEQVVVKPEQAVVKLEQAVVKPKQAVVKSEQVVVKPEQAVVKLEQAVVKPEQAVVKLKQAVVKPEQAVVKLKQAVVKPEQAVVKPKQEVVKPELAATPLSNTIKRPIINEKPIKFEIPVTLPDKDKFPLLSEKIVAAYNRHLQVQQPSSKSIGALFHQLDRLNKWSSDNRAASRTESGSQPDKLATDLKGTLKDLFRYISHKEGLKTGKAVERAIRQSGTFLEKRINSQQQQQNQKQQTIKPSAELTVHKDLKANLNRVLATALYNLAKIKLTQPTTTSQSINVATADKSPQNASQIQRQLSNQAPTLNSNLLTNIKNKLRRITAGKTVANNLPELEAITKDVVKNVQSALSRNQLSQLTNLRPESSAQQWLFEVPVINNKELNVFSIYLKEDTDEVDEISKQRRWSLVLQFDIGALGKIRTMLSWSENKIQVKFLAEQPNTVALVDSEMEQFQQTLSKIGISFEQLSVEQAALDDLRVQFSKEASHV